MLDIKFIRENPGKVKENCRKRQVKVDIDELLELDKQKRDLLQNIEELRAERNKRPSIERGKEIKKQLKKMEPKFKAVKKAFKELAYLVPNMLAPDVPQGKSEADNKIIKKKGSKPEFDFTAKDHLELGQELDIIDVKRAAKVSGSRFSYLKGKGALLEMALINFAFEKIIKKGFIPILPPVMLRAKMARGMGYFEQADEQEAYYLAKDDLYLVGTSEQSIGVMHSKEIFEEENLPKRYVGFSTCFRREAGSHGKDTRGIIRVHQFDKVEMFVFCKPEQSEKEHQLLLSIEEELMRGLNLPYQVVHLCSADMGRPSSSTYDIETWIPSQNKYRETHSCSNCTDFQARRLKIRYKNTKTNKNEFVHMLNGTALAIPRILVAILENNQQKDGGVKAPKVLQKYTGFEKISQAN